MSIVKTNLDFARGGKEIGYNRYQRHSVFSKPLSVSSLISIAKLNIYQNCLPVCLLFVKLIYGNKQHRFMLIDIIIS